MTETERILALWQQEGSIKAASRKADMSEQRVRRILIDNGVCPTARAREINALISSGMTPEEVAARLGIAVATVQYYLPYKRGAYTRDSSTTAWRRSKDTE